jgi:hypothetical protein
VRLGLARLGKVNACARTDQPRAGG